MAERPKAPGASRPLSPHLSIWKWQVHSITSITHRITGNAMALGAVWLFLWWLIAAATGAEAYGTFLAVATGPIGILVGLGCTWIFFQHLGSGLRHLFMDTGKGLEIGTSKTLATATWVFSTVMTIATWAFIYTTKGI